MSNPMFVSAAWVAAKLDAGEFAVLDARQPFAYSQAHIPGAASLPLVALAMLGPGASQDAILHMLGEAGVADDTHVVLYDDGASPTATHLAFLLYEAGHTMVSVLEGGIYGWVGAGGTLEAGIPAIAPAASGARSTPAPALATLGDALAAIDDPGSIILDVRGPDEYSGRYPSARRNGHIPGAVNIDWTENLEVVDGVPRLLPLERLRTLYRNGGITEDKRVIVHCQSGSRSTFTWLVLKHLGFPAVLNYARGWQEWGNKADTPVDAS